MQWYRYLVVAVLLLLPSAYALGQDSVFELAQESPVITNGERGEWDDDFTDPGAVLFHDGLFHMFRNGFRDWPGEVGIGYLTSPDGITWTEASPLPVFRTSEVAFAQTAALASSVLVEEDGTWVLYFYTHNQDWSNQIGRATASDPLGPWTVEPAPILSQGESGAWDDFSVSAPQVVKTDSGYLMYYSGHAEESFWTNQIGLATSEDGLTWLKQPDPILSAEEGERIVHQPRVEQTDTGWVMVYRSALGEGNMRLGLATSLDGLTWQRTAQPIFWEKNIIPQTSGFWFTALEYHQGVYYLYIEAGSFSNTQIYVATAASLTE
jgi:predicted GH43/DUF377 family glycosyl hydrolase